MALAGILVAAMALFLTTVRLVAARPGPSGAATGVSVATGETLSEPASLPAAEVVRPAEAVPAPRSSGVRFTARQVEPSYTVVQGDSLFAIAQRFSTSAEAIQSINNLPNTALRVGQRLVIP